MYRYFTKLLIIFIFILMLLFPSQVFTGASNGLLLWFNSVLPTLLPFVILSNLLIRTHAADLIVRVTGPLFRHIFQISDYASFAAVIGFLCGYPMGSKVTADLLKAGKLSYGEAQYLLSFCNNASPIFITSYVVLQNLGQERLLLPALIILISSPILASFLFRRLMKPSQMLPAQNGAGNLTTEEPSHGNLIDTCIMNGFETITKVGGYIMLFSIFTTLAQMYTVPCSLFRYLLLPSLEITGGITLICQSALSAEKIFFLCMVCTSFGGWCAAAQTKCMIADTSLMIKPYILQKLATSIVTSLLCYLYLQFFFS